MITPDVTDEVVAFYRLAARRHRKLAKAEMGKNHPLMSRRHRVAADKVERAIVAELSHEP